MVGCAFNRAPAAPLGGALLTPPKCVCGTVDPTAYHETDCPLYVVEVDQCEPAGFIPRGEDRAARRERVWKKHLAGELMTLDKFLEARGWFYSHAKWCDMCAAVTTPPINCCHTGANAAGADHEIARLRSDLERAREGEAIANAAAGALWWNPTPEQRTPTAVRLRIEEILGRMTDAERTAAGLQTELAQTVEQAREEIDRLRSKLKAAEFDRDHHLHTIQGFGANPPPRVWLISSMMGGHFKWGTEAEIRAKWPDDDPDTIVVGYVEVGERTKAQEESAKLRKALQDAYNACDTVGCHPSKRCERCAVIAAALKEAK